MRIVTNSEYLTLPRKPQNWLVEGFYPAGSVALLIGEPKAGKSFFALQLAYAIARGEKFLGRQCEQGTVLYINLDTSDASWTTRLQGMQAHGFDLSGPVYSVHPEDSLRPCNILSLAVQRQVVEAVKQCQPSLIVIDVLRELHNQKEESSTEMKVVFDTLLTLTGDAAVLGVHHTVKISNKEDIRVVDLVRGTSYVAGRAETIWCLMDDRLYVEPRFSEKQILRGERDNGLWVLPPL